MKNVLFFILISFLLIQNIQAQNWDQVIKACASDREEDDRFGWSVAISGDYAIVGAILEDDDENGGNTIDAAGSAYILKQVGGVWVQQQKIAASDRAAWDLFGCSVAISGDYAIVGAYNEDENNNGGATLNNAGSAYIFKRTGEVWGQQQKIVSSDRAVDDWFGNSVSISGDYAIIGAKGEDEDVNGGSTLNGAGSVYFFKQTNGVWAQQQKVVSTMRNQAGIFGNKVSMNGDYALVVGGTDDAVYFIKQTNGVWAVQQRIASPTLGINFGSSISISGNYAIVGAQTENVSTELSVGQAYIYKLNGNVWSFQQKIRSSDYASGDAFGQSVSISGDFIIVGAHGEDHDAIGGNTMTFSGSAYIFKQTGGVWSQKQKIVAPDRAAYNQFSYDNAVSISSTNIIVGVFKEGEDALGTNTLLESGSVYFFELSPLNMTVSSTDVPCSYLVYGGTISITPTGGLSPYTYSIDGINYQSSPDFNNLSVNNYTVYVMDAAGNIASESINVGSAPPLVIVSTSFTNLPCNESCGGTASVIVEGGTPYYSYFWDSPNSYNSSATTGLCPGNYTVTVTDNNGCTASSNFDINVFPIEIPYIELSGDGCSNNSTLTINGAENASQIMWFNDGNNFATYNGSVTTVAGGNGGGNGANQIDPFAIALDVNGNLFVSDNNASRVQKFPPGSTSATNGVTVAGGNGPGSAANQFFMNWDIDIDHSGNLYVADYANNRIQKFPPGSTSSTNGTTVGFFDNFSGTNYGSPVALTRDADGNIYTSTIGGTSSGIYYFSGNTNPIAYQAYQDCKGLSIDPSGNIYASLPDRIYKHLLATNTWSVVAGGNGQGNGANMLNYPEGTAIDLNGNLYVADYYNNRVQMFPAGSTSATNGVTIVGDNWPGSGNNQLNGPTSVAVAENGEVYIADAGNNRIQKWSQYVDNSATNLTNLYEGDYYALVTIQGCSFYSNTVHITPTVTPNVSIAVNNAPICPGSVNTFTATTIENGGANPVFQWKKNGNNVGTNSTIYIDSLINNNDQVWVEMTSDYPCTYSNPVSSNHLVLTVSNCGAILSLQAEEGINYFDTLDVNVSIINGDNLFAIYGKLNFDDNAMRLVQSAETGYLGTNVIATPPIVTGGVIDFGVTKTSGQGGTSGDGLFYTFRFVLTNLPTTVPFNANSPDSTFTRFTLTNLTVNDATGAQRVVGLPQPDTTWLRYYVPVWPGDLNNDYHVNVADILPIGYFYNSTGPVRPNASLQWIAQPAPLWDFDKTNHNSPAYKTFADGNGSGLIDLADQGSIGFNLSNIHALQIPNNMLKAKASNAPELSVNISPTTIDSTQLPLILSIPINVGSSSNPISNLYGLAFDLLFDQTYVDTTNIQLDYSNTIFGNLNADYIKIEDLHPGSGRLSIGMTRYNTTELNNYGEVLTVNMPIRADVATGWFKFRAVPLASNDITGLELEVNGGIDSVYVITPIPNSISQIDEKERIIIYPNPTTGEITITGLTEKAIATIMDATGRMVLATEVVNNKVDVSALANGVYVLRVETGNGVSNFRIIKQ